MPPRRRNLADVLAQTAPEDVASTDTPPPATPDEKPRKYTMLVSAEDDVIARRVVDQAVATSGIRPVKSMRGDVVRALMAEADEDPALLNRVAARLRDGTTA